MATTTTVAQAVEARSDGPEDEDDRRRRRVRARWSMLRRALLGPPRGAGEGAGAARAEVGGGGGGGGGDDVHSTNAFAGFGCLDRAVLSEEERNAARKDLVAADDEDWDEWDVVRNSHASATGHSRVLRFWTRESKGRAAQRAAESTAKRRMEALLSHRTHGVDNTGNVRVWDAEATLAGFLLSLVFDGVKGGKGQSETCKGQCKDLSNLKESLRSILVDSTSSGVPNDQSFPSSNLLELGAGQAGLAGLSLAAASNDGGGDMKPLHVVLTDGHPKCVENNRVCASMMRKSNALARAKIDAELLLWDAGSEGNSACHRINELIDCQTEAISNGDTVKEGSYNLCLASDCVHFQEFHDGLLTTIARTLVVGGIALLCQPRRGDSLQNFMKLVDVASASSSARARTRLFEVTLFEDFYPKVSEMHEALVSETARSPEYDPNRHRPLLLVLRKMRLYDEEEDGGAIRHHLRPRSSLGIEKTVDGRPGPH
ncbi:hypothetical protein ACHAWF_015695 [Thalassiosira exigua]